MSQERRHFTRIDFKKTADLGYEGRIYKDLQIRNLSLKGCFLDMPDTSGIALERYVDIFINLNPAEDNSGEDNIIQASGKVIRITRNGIAVFFTRIGVDSYAYLKKILEINLGNDELLEKELLEYINQHNVHLQ